MAIRFSVQQSKRVTQQEGEEEWSSFLQIKAGTPVARCNPSQISARSGSGTASPSECSELIRDDLGEIGFRGLGFLDADAA